MSQSKYWNHFHLLKEQGFSSPNNAFLSAGTVNYVARFAFKNQVAGLRQISS
jgi:hypothetical protein